MSGVSEHKSTRQWRSCAFVAIALLAALLGLGNKIVRCTARDGTAHVEVGHAAGTCSHSDSDHGSAPPQTCARTNDVPHQEALLEHWDCQDVSILGSGVPSPRRSTTPIPATGAFARIADEPALTRCTGRGLRPDYTGPPRHYCGALLRHCTVLLI